MEDGRIPKDILYGQLTAGKRNTGRPKLRFKDVCKRDMKNLNIDTDSWEDLASDRLHWRSTLRTPLQAGEERMMEGAAEKRAHRKNASTNRSTPPQPCLTPLRMSKASERFPLNCTVPFMLEWKDSIMLSSLGGQPIFSRAF